MPPASRPPGRWPVAALRWTLGVIVLGLVVLLLRDLEWRRVLGLLRTVAPWPLALAVLVSLTLNTYARARRRAVLLAAVPRRGPPVGLGELTLLLLASFAANNLLPARAGDVLFALQLSRRHDYPLSSVAAAQVVEKVVEVLSLWLLAPVTLLLVPQLTVALAVPLYCFIGAGAVGMGTVAWALHTGPGRGGAPAERGGRWLTAFMVRWVDAVRGLLTPRTWWRGLLWSCAQDLADVSMIWLCARAVGLQAGLGASLLVYLGVNLAISLPSAPGQIGFLEAGAVLVLVGLGVGQSEALALALLYHAVHLVPVTLVGSWCLYRLGWRPKVEGVPAPPGSASASGASGLGA